MSPEILILVLLAVLAPVYVLIIRMLRKPPSPPTGTGRPTRRRRNLPFLYAWSEQPRLTTGYHFIEPPDCPQQVLRLPWEIPGRAN